MIKVCSKKAIASMIGSFDGLGRAAAEESIFLRALEANNKVVVKMNFRRI
jgi:hypothetical protein